MTSSLLFRFGSFASTSCEVVALDDAGRDFLAEIAGSSLPVLSITLPKTRGADLESFAARRGISTSTECGA